MDATVRFYHGTLGARLVATIGTPDFRHYFFEFGPQCTVAFFEYANASTSRSRRRPARPIRAPSSSTTSSLNLPDEEALIDLQRRLKSADCEVTDIVDHQSFAPSTSPTRTASRSKPRGGCSTRPAARPTTATARQFADHDPVPAVRELADRGELVSSPRPSWCRSSGSPSVDRLAFLGRLLDHASRFGVAGRRPDRRDISDAPGPVGMGSCPARRDPSRVAMRSR